MKRETNTGLKLATGWRLVIAIVLTFAVAAWGAAFAQRSSGPYRDPPSDWVFWKK